MPQESNGSRSIDKRKSRAAVQPKGPAFSTPVPVHHSTAVIPSRHLGRWIEPWYVAYAILGALASGSAVILIPLAVISRGGSATQVGAAIAALNVGALFAPFWGWLSDRFKNYRPIFFGGFLLIGAGFLSFALNESDLTCHM
jgi:Major Facilitator Superfamily